MRTCMFKNACACSFPIFTLAWLCNLDGSSTLRQSLALRRQISLIKTLLIRITIPMIDVTRVHVEMTEMRPIHVIGIWWHQENSPPPATSEPSITERTCIVEPCTPDVKEVSVWIICANRHPRCKRKPNHMACARRQHDVQMEHGHSSDSSRSMLSMLNQRGFHL